MIGFRAMVIVNAVVVVTRMRVRANGTRLALAINRVFLRSFIEYGWLGLQRIRWHCNTVSISRCVKIEMNKNSMSVAIRKNFVLLRQNNLGPTMSNACWHQSIRGKLSLQLLCRFRINRGWFEALCEQFITADRPRVRGFSVVQE